MIREAITLSGNDIGTFVRFIDSDSDNIAVGELRQIYHIGGRVTVNVDTLADSRVLLEYELADDAKVDINDPSEFAKMTINQVLTSGDVR